MIRRYGTCLLILIGFLFIPHKGISSPVSSQDESARIVQQLKEREKSLNTLTATFIQVKSTRLLKEPLHSEGTIYFQAPGMMLCKILNPTPVTLLFKNRLFLVYYPNTGKSKERHLGNNILKEYFGMGKPIEEFEKHYAFTLDSIGNDGTYHLKLIPRQKRMAQRIEMIEMDIAPDQWLPHRIDILEKNGDFTSIRLEVTSINEPLAAEIFLVDIPDDGRGTGNGK